MVDYASIPSFIFQQPIWSHLLQQQQQQQLRNDQDPQLLPLQQLQPIPLTKSAGVAAFSRPDSTVDDRARQEQPAALQCPRCESTNTKFCYYNNYSLSQPRHFCKSCRRYWTRGGSLRNIPVGGGCRKNKRKVVKFSEKTNNNDTKSKINRIGAMGSTESTVVPPPRPPFFINGSVVVPSPSNTPNFHFEANHPVGYQIGTGLGLVDNHQCDTTEMLYQLSDGLPDQFGFITRSSSEKMEFVKLNLQQYLQ